MQGVGRQLVAAAAGLALVITAAIIPQRKNENPFKHIKGEMYIEK